jgi:hypothetical protein
MKKTLPIFLVFFFATISFQCDLKSPICCEYPIGDIDIKIKSIYADKPLIINQINEYNGKKIRFTKFQFFLNHEINYFDNPDTTTTNLDRIPRADLLDFTSLNDSAKAAVGVQWGLSSFKGDKKIMILDIGVGKKLNAKLPKDFTPSEPLFDTTNYRTDWKSFIFVKLEGTMDKDGDGIFETVFKIHTGGDNLLKNVKFNKNYTVGGVEMAKINFELNMNELLKGIDLANLDSAQQTTISPAARQLMDNFSTAFILK